MRLAHQLALESEQITADMVEAAEFPDLVQRYGIRAVPHIVINGRTAFVGALPEAEFVSRVLEAAGVPAKPEQKS